MDTNKENVRGLKLGTVYKVLITLTCLLAAALFYATETAVTYYDEMNALNQEYRYLQEQANTLQEASDYLTDQVQEFLFSADLANLEAYFEEVHVTKRRENALLELSKQQYINYDDVSLAVNESNELMQREIYAMKLMVIACGYDETGLPEDIRRMTLDAEDLALAPRDQMDKARQMVHADTYHQVKDEIHENLVEFSEKALLDVEQRIEAGHASLQRSMEVSRAILVLLVSLIMLSSVLLTYLVLKPLNTFLANIREKSMLTETGSYEFRHLAQVYNRIYAEKEESEHQKTIYQHKAERDRLTGTYSREYFFEKAEEMIQAEEGELYIVRINVCRFKLVNELQGAAKGDQLLAAIGEKLNELSREYGLVASRFSADRFYLCVRKEDFDRIELVRKISLPWLAMDVAITYGVCPVDRETPVIVLCDRANMALRSNSHKLFDSVYFYNDQFHQQLLQEQEIESEMESALAERQFFIYIQPKVNVDTDRIVGGEVLVRWKHPEKGLISPGVFIGIFEKNGFILPLDYYVWEESCRFLSECKEKGLAHTPLSINVSRLHFYSGELKSRLLELVNRYHLEPSDLELEITESIYVDEPDIILEQCSELQALGFKIAMDDFGSGYSSLNMLKKMPLDIIKMDLRFLADDTDAAEAAKGQDILRTQIELAHTLEISVVVEGLETEAQKNFIKDVGNCVAQGYYYSRPVDCQRYLELSVEKA